MSIPAYPLVFVHGLFGWGADEGIDKKIPYWGATTGNLMEFLAAQGAECYSASVGPVSSAWDRACELYARLTGTKVDYGKAHAERFNHNRFGRTYEEPLFEGWSSEKKIHLIGHSFGGTTVRLLSHLLTYGDKAEQEATPEAELSPLFKGGHGDWVQSLTTICAPHNGAVAFHVAQKYKILSVMKTVAYNYIGIAGRSKMQGDFVDFHLEQYGLSDTPGKEDALPMGRAKRKFSKNEDNVEYDMSPDGAKKLNDYVEMNPDCYHFSYAFNSVVQGKVRHPKNTDFFFLKATSGLILADNFLFRKGREDHDVMNDGLVEVSSALHPDDEPFTDFDENNVNKGIWNVFPVQEGDHGTPIGLFADPEKTHEFYLNLLDLLFKTEQFDRKPMETAHD